MSLHSRAFVPTQPLNLSADGAYAFALDDADIDNSVQDWDENEGECPVCGNNSWTSMTYGQYSQVAMFTFGRSRYVDYDGMETQGIEDQEAWQCDNGHNASETISDMLHEQQ